MSEQRRAVHSQEPAEGADEKVEAPASRGRETRPTPRRPTRQAKRSGPCTLTSPPKAARIR